MQSGRWLIVSVLTSLVLNVDGRTSHGLSSGTGVPFGSLLRVMYIGDFVCEDAPDIRVVNSLDRLSLVEEVMTLQEGEVDARDVLANIHNFSPNLVFYSTKKHNWVAILEVVEECKARGIHTISVLFDLYHTIQNLTINSPALYFDQILVDYWDSELEERLSLSSLPEWFGHGVSSASCAPTAEDRLSTHPDVVYDVCMYLPSFDEERCREEDMGGKLACSVHSFLKGNDRIKYRLETNFLTGEELASLYLHSRIVVIVLEGAVELHGISYRCEQGGMYEVYRALAMGAFVIFNEVKGLDLDLVNGSDVITFRSDSMSSLATLIDHYLQDGEARLQVVQNAQVSVCDHLSLESKLSDILLRASQSMHNLHVCKGPSLQTSLQTPLVGTQIQLSTLIEHDDFRNHTGLLISKVPRSYKVTNDGISQVDFEASEREFHSTHCLNEDRALLEQRLPRAMVTQELSQRGMFLVCMQNYMVVADGVICNGVEAPITSFGRHRWYPPVPHGCDWAQNGVVEAQSCSRALLLVRKFGWFWAHFVQDLVYKLAFTMNALPAGTEFEYQTSFMEAATD
eukprot:554889-Hanusia_phi.AAC.3